MSDTKNVGVFPCGSEVGLEIHRALKYYRHFKLFGLSSVHDHGKLVYKNYLGDIPFITNDTFISEIKQVITEKELDFIIPAMDEAGYLLKTHEEELECEVVYPDVTTADIIRRKSTTCRILDGTVKVPEVYTKREEILCNLPVFAKPDIGYGSRGAFKLDSPEQVPDEIRNDYIYTEHLPGEEYTIDCFSDSDGKLLFSGARKRARIRMGISVATFPAQNQDHFNEIARAIGEKLQMTGIWFFQLKRDKDDVLTLLEVAGRVSGSMALFRGYGVNFIAAELFRRCGYTVSFNINDYSTALLDRSFDCVIDFPESFEAVYCDFDDCLLLGDEVNTNLIAFLYQCVNKGKKIILLTRHATDPVKTLREKRLTALFDEIIHITDRMEPKYKFIESDRAIFIDDSFAERKSVKDKLGITVFAPDAIDLIKDRKM